MIAIINESLTFGVITLDMTFLFQIINLIIILLIVIGIPIIIFKIIKTNKIRNNELKELNKTMDFISKEISKKAE